MTEKQEPKINPSDSVLESQKRDENLDSAQSNNKARLFKNSEDDQLQQELTECRIAQKECQEKYMRVVADLANFNKRIEREKAEWFQVARAELLTKLLPIVDDFDRAVEKEQVTEGIAMIHKSLQDLLSHAGVEEITSDQFDPEMHEALLQVEAEGKQSGEIVEVMQKGYKLGEKILRPAKVSVAK